MMPSRSDVEFSSLLRVSDELSEVKNARDSVTINQMKIRAIEISSLGLLMIVVNTRSKSPSRVL